MKKILLSGFEPFGKYNKNPTEDLVQFFNGKNIGKYEIEALLLPVTYKDSFKRLKTAIDQCCPDLIILTGLAAERKEIHLERIAINWIESTLRDNNKVLVTGKKIINKGPDGLFTGINISKLRHNLKKSKIRMNISNSAGTFVCNYLYYKTLLLPKYNKKTLFIHFPLTKSESRKSKISKEYIYVALERIIKSL